jgi:hypothetical protein
MQTKIIIYNTVLWEKKYKKNKKQRKYGKQKSQNKKNIQFESAEKNP